LDYVLRWYVHAGDLISDKEWEAFAQIARQAARMFALDDAMLEKRDQVQRAYMMRAVSKGNRLDP
jgi:hypothetical protein